MEGRRVDGSSVRVGLLALLVAIAGCGEGGGDARAGDLPGPAHDAFQEPGVVDATLLPRDGDLSGFAVAFRGDFVVTAEESDVEQGSTLALLNWDDEAQGWSNPLPFDFSSAETGDGGPSLAPDGSYLLFHSARPGGNPAAGDMNIWVAQREESEDGEVNWTDPWLVPGVFSPAWDGTPSLAGDGTLYFASMRDGPATGRELFVAPFEQGTWMAPQKLPESVNSFGDDMDPFVGPDSEFILFSSNREGDFDLYVVFAQGEGWGEPMALNETVNTGGADERTPYLSSSGSTLFWIRDGELMAAPADATGLAEAQQAAGGSGESDTGG